MVMRIIGLAGKSGNGKDVVGKMMHDFWGYHPLPLSLQVKLDAVSKFGLTYDEIFVTKPPHARRLLQEIGTERGRMVYGVDMWISATFAFAQWMSDNWGIHKFVITDVRFQNELNYLKEHDMPVFRVIADATINDTFGLKGDAARHSSETDLDHIPVTMYDGIIYNQYNRYDNLQDQLENILSTLAWKQS